METLKMLLYGNPKVIRNNHNSIPSKRNIYSFIPKIVTPGDRDGVYFSICSDECVFFYVISSSEKVIGYMFGGSPRWILYTPRFVERYFWILIHVTRWILYNKNYKKKLFKLFTSVQICKFLDGKVCFPFPTIKFDCNMQPLLGWQPPFSVIYFCSKN